MSGLTGHFRKVLAENGQPSLLKWILSWEGLKMFGDGNIGYIKLIKGPVAGTLVGEDKFGNRYYENNNLDYDRKRWVLYKDTFDYTPSQISPEWHGWLNYINDYNPKNHQFSQPIYKVEAHATKTGSDEAYQPKGAWAQPRKRSWIKYEAWAPPQQQQKA